MGRFISADTVVPEPGNPQSLNRLAYTYNNPLRYNDPSGHTVTPCGSYCNQPNIFWLALTWLFGEPLQIDVSTASRADQTAMQISCTVLLQGACKVQDGYLQGTTVGENLEASIASFGMVDVGFPGLGGGQYLVNGVWSPDPVSAPVKFGYTENLEKYVGKIPGVSYLEQESWFRGGVVSDKAFTSGWQAQALEAMKNSSSINFIVDNMAIFDAPDGYKSHIFATHWEMDQVILNGYTDKLHLWLNGQELTGELYLQWIKQWKTIRDLP